MKHLIRSHIPTREGRSHNSGLGPSDGAIMLEIHYRKKKDVIHTFERFSDELFCSAGMLMIQNISEPTYRQYLKAPHMASFVVH